MGRARLQIGRLIGWAPLLLLSVSARAEQAATQSWDDRHMQSNFARYLDDVTTRPAILGVDRDGRIARDAAATPTQVPELVLHLSPHEWRRGGSIGSNAAPGPGLTSSSFSWSDDGATADRSSGLRNQSSVHGAVHSGAR